MCIYIDYIDKKNLSNDQCCFRVDIWGVYTACLSCNNFFLFSFFFFFGFFFFCEWKIVYGAFCMKAAICCTWANNCVYKTLVFINESMIELSFRLYPYQIVDYLPFKVFLLCICKKCVWIKIHQTENTLCLKVQVWTFYETELCRIREAVLLQMQTTQV